MSTAAIPQNHMQALQRANKIRLARATLKRRIVNEEISAALVILECPDEAQSWPIGELIISQRRWGRARTRRLLNRVQIIETKPVGMLTSRQRHALAAALGHVTERSDG